MSHTPHYGKTCPHAYKSQHVKHVPYHVVNHQNMAHTKYIKQYSSRIKGTSKYTYLKNEIHLINLISSYTYLRLGVLYKVNQCGLTIHTLPSRHIKIITFLLPISQYSITFWQYRNSDLTILSISNILSDEIKGYQYTFYTTF